MSVEQLYKNLISLDPGEIDTVFGMEASLRIPNGVVPLAPVKRVMLISEAFYPKVDGVSKTAYLTLRYLQQTGREVMVLAPDTSPANVGPSRIVALRSLGLPFAPETRVALPPSLSIGRYLEEFQPDLIHMFSPALMSVSGMHAGRRRSIPVVANYQTDLPAYTQHYGFDFLTGPMRYWLRYIHNGCHLTLVPSYYTMRQLRTQGYRRMRIWRRGVDSDRFNPLHRSTSMRQRLLNGRDPNSLLCIYVGRLATEKRVDLLVDVARLPGVALTIIGDGAERSELQKLFVGTDTFFTGYMYGEDLSRAYASADVFAFTGPSETFGQVVQEALASGLPAVIINQGGITDLVTNGVTGYQCPDDPKAFAEAIAHLRDHPELRDEMSRTARREAERSPWEAIMTQLEGYYGEAVDLNDRYERAYRIPEMLQRPLPAFLNWMDSTRPGPFL